MRQGKLIVLSGPSGVGKDAVLQQLLAQDKSIVKIVSATTRPPRFGEIDGVDYRFISQAQFERGIEVGEFLEYAKYGENYYGTPLASISETRALGKHVLLKIEVQGAKDIRKLIPEAVLLFLAPPDLDELERRLRGRGTDTEDAIQLRLEIAADELAHALHYDQVIVNVNIDEAVSEMRRVIGSG